MHEPKPNHSFPSTSQTLAQEASVHGIPATAFCLKRCRSCDEEKPASAYYEQSGSPGTLRPSCKACLGKAAQQRRNARRTEAQYQEQRTCRHCDRVQPAHAFAHDRRCRSGRGSTCLECRNRRARGLAQLEGDLERPDETITQNTSLYERRIDLGIAVALATCPPGHCRSREELAAYAGVTAEVIRRIEHRALEKMRKRAMELLAAGGFQGILKVSL